MDDGMGKLEKPKKGMCMHDGVQPKETRKKERKCNRVTTDFASMELLPL